MRKLSVLLEFPALGCARVRTAASAGHPRCSKRPEKQPLKSLKGSFIVTCNYDGRLYSYSSANDSHDNDNTLQRGVNGYFRLHRGTWANARLVRRQREWAEGVLLGEEQARHGRKAWGWLVSGLQQVMRYSCGVYSVHGGENLQAVGSWQKEAPGVRRGII